MAGCSIHVEVFLQEVVVLDSAGVSPVGKVTKALVVSRSTSEECVEVSHEKSSLARDNIPQVGQKVA